MLADVRRGARILKEKCLPQNLTLGRHATTGMPNSLWRVNLLLLISETTIECNRYSEDLDFDPFRTSTAAEIF
jgi:hypothetical protein